MTVGEHTGDMQGTPVSGTASFISRSLSSPDGSVRFCCFIRSSQGGVGDSSLELHSGFV